MTSAKPPIQDQILAIKREHILEAAIKVFAEKGFHRSKVKDVANAAGIADGTLYNYFGSKDDLLLGILDRLNESDERRTSLTDISRDDFREFFADYLRHRLEVVFPNVEVFQALLPEVISNPTLRNRYYQEIIVPTTSLAEGFFKAQIEAGKLEPFDIALTTRGISGMVLGLLVQTMLGDALLQERWHDLPNALAHLILEGLAPKKSL